MQRPFAACAAALFAAAAAAPAVANAPRPQIMVVGVAHLAAKRDLHNSTWGSSVFDPRMQTQIATIVDRIARFRPTKVMIEASPQDSKYVRRYQAYLRGSYALGPNEDDQFGYRLAKIGGLKTIYPIDSVGDFPFDYDGLTKAAKSYGQQAILAKADAYVKPLVDRSNQLERADRLIDVLTYINSREALRLNSGWYMAVNPIGRTPSNYAGAALTAAWYARNLNILANIERDASPGDRIVVFIGQGHAAMLRPMIDNSPFVSDVDPVPYISGTSP